MQKQSWRSPPSGEVEVNLEVHVLVPVKPLAAAKSRLAPILGPGERETFSQRMLKHVLKAIREAGIDFCWVVGGDPRIEGIARETNCLPLPELGEDLNTTLERAIREVASDGLVLILPADLPLLTAGEVRMLVSAMGPGQGVIASDRRGEGTNAIGFPGEVALSLSFGPGSFSRHLKILEESGVSVCRVDLPGLAFDVDTPGDLLLLATLASCYPHLVDLLPPRLLEGPSS